MDLIRNKSEQLGPLILLGICILAFGLFIPLLGFYWDDWPTIFYTFNARIDQLVSHFSYDRPFSVWTYWLVGQLGTSPWTWQVTALLLNWASALAVTWALTPLWKEHYKKIFYIALLFAIYPGYYVQPSSVIFIPHLTSLVLFLISLGAMGRAVTDKLRALPYTVLAVVTAAIQMFTVEYFVGLELVRPFYAWFLLKNSGEKTELKKIARIWSPYLIVFALWVSWRLFLLKLPAEPYPLVLVSDFMTDPLAAFGQLLLVIINDLQYTLIQTWANLIQPLFASLSSSLGLVAAFISLVVGILLFLYLSEVPGHKKSEGISDQEFARQGIILGAGAFLLGMFPIWVIGETIAQGDYNLRYILVGMLGASLVVVSVVILFISNKNHRVFLFSLLVAFALSSHIHNANEYRLDWEKQRAFYWQLVWRAPQIEPHTALISFDRISKNLGDPMTGNALNVLYPLDDVPPSVVLWNFELTRTKTVEAIQNGELLQNDYRGLIFSTETSQDLLFYFLPEDGCLWVLDPSAVNNMFLPDENRDLVGHSNLSRILPTQENSNYPPRDIFGKEPDHNWCYYFEKADLARQNGDWDHVVRLMEEAKQNGFSPNYGIEWLPLVEAEAAMGNWDQAVEASQRVLEMHARNLNSLCDTWISIIELSEDTEASHEAFDQVTTFANCDSQ